MPCMNDGAVDISSITPSGVTMGWTGYAASIPAGWLLCDGSAISRTVYASLFAAIGTLWGGGDGVNTFNLPNSLDRFPLCIPNAVTNPGGTGGSTGKTTDGHAHTSHDLESAGAHTHTMTDLNVCLDNPVGIACVYTQSAGAHIHSAPTIDAANDTIADIRPKYYVKAEIIKT